MPRYTKCFFRTAFFTHTQRNVFSRSYGRKIACWYWSKRLYPNPPTPRPTSNPCPVPSHSPATPNKQKHAVILLQNYFFGKPPLQYYLGVIQDQRWDRIDVVTFASNAQTLNPVIPELRRLNATGQLPDNFYIHTVSVYKVVCLLGRNKKKHQQIHRCWDGTIKNVAFCIELYK